MLNKTIETDLTAFDIFSSLYGQQHPFILDSSMNNTSLGRYSFVGAEPFLTFSSKGNKCSIARHGKVVEIIIDDPLTVLDRILKEYPVQYSGEIPFIGGAVGYFAYDLCHFIEKLPRKAVDDVNIPDCFFGFYDGIYAIDHQLGKVEIVALGINSSEEDTLARLEFNLCQVMERRPQVGSYHNLNSESFQTNMTKTEYLEAVCRIREYIREGDIYQANFTQRFECQFAGNPLSFYDKLRKINPAPFAAFIDVGDCLIISSSPERFIRICNGLIETRPIKGTVARGKTMQEDEANRVALLGSEKDRAELLMIVDLERNDLSRVAQKGTVKVEELFVLETYATVHHLAATITARIRPECSIIDCVRATFPGGSITGAPKIRAMEIIDELEPTQRNVYTGSIGYIGFNGNVDLNIVIRTVLIKDNRAYLQAGGAIVWDSEPEIEYQESLIKARALMEALQSQVKL